MAKAKKPTTTDEIMALAMACRSRVVDEAIGAERELRSAVGALLADRDAKANQIITLIVEVKALLKTLEKVEAERERCAKLCRSLMPPEGVIRRTLLDLERSILDGDAT